MGSKQDPLLTIMRDAMHEMTAGARIALEEAVKLRDAYEQLWPR
jgi:hypothetical protein